jgi:hypothetical protein
VLDLRLAVIWLCLLDAMFIVIWQRPLDVSSIVMRLFLRPFVKRRRVMPVASVHTGRQVIFDVRDGVSGIHWHRHRRFHIVC